jgi:hypothetical protein
MRGVLHPHVIDGVHFFDPQEIMPQQQMLSIDDWNARLAAS